MAILERFSALENKKADYLTRAESIAELTMPKIFPKDGNGSGNLTEAQQSLGSNGVTTLASKLMLILFPPTGSTRYSIDEMGVEKRNDVLDLTANIIDGLDLDQEIKDSEKSKLQNEKKTSSGLKAALRLLEKRQDNLLNNSGLINKIGYGMLHFIITGSFAFFIDKDLTSRLYTLRHFVVDRDRNGEIIEAIARDYVSFASLNEEQQNLILSDTDKEPDEMVDIGLYLQSKRISKNKWEIKEYAEDTLLREWTLKNNPLIVPFTDQESGNVYNYGLANEIKGDLKAFEQLTKNTKQISAAASKIVFLVHQAGGMMIKDLNEAENLDFVFGDADKIKTLQIDKLNDLAIVGNEKQELASRISMFFMLNSAATRDSPRTTAFEIQTVIADIDAAFGNLYGMLAQEIQLPVAKIMLEYMTTDGELKGIIPKDLEISIVSVKQALANEANVRNMQVLIDTANNLQVPKKINADAVLADMCTTMDFSYDEYILNDEEHLAVLKRDQQMILELEQMKIQFQMQMQELQQQIQQQAQQQQTPQQTPEAQQQQTTGEI